MDIVFYVAFEAGERFRIPAAEAPRRRWWLPLYPYPKKLDGNVRSWLPHALLDWNEESAADQDVECPPGVALGRSNVSAWAPDLVMVTQDVSVLPREAGDIDEANEVVEEHAAWLAGNSEGPQPVDSPLTPILARALGSCSGHPIAQQLKANGAHPHPLWAFGTVRPGWSAPHHPGARSGPSNWPIKTSRASSPTPKRSPSTPGRSSTGSSS